MATHLVLVRHGETDWNREHRLQGWSDPPLNVTGRGQARALAEALRDDSFDVLVTSDLRRAAETAEIVGAALGIPVVHDAAFREVDLGSWSGRLRHEIEGLERPDGETRDQLRDRVVAAVVRIATDHVGKRVLVVSHGGSLRSLEEHATGIRGRPLANCEHFEVRVDGGRISIVEQSRLPTPADPEADDAEALGDG